MNGTLHRFLDSDIWYSFRTSSSDRARRQICTSSTRPSKYLSAQAIREGK